RSMIELDGLTKYYGDTRGIEDVDLKVDKGEIFGFLGPNGAGKTTTIRLLLDLLRPTEGKAFINGYDCNRESGKVKEEVEYLPGNFTPYNFLTGREYIEFMGEFYDEDKVNKGLEMAELLELDISRKTSEYSTGMKQKLGIIQSLMANTPLNIMDEPTSGLDPMIQQKFYSLLEGEKQAGDTVFLSSHILPVVERVCDRVGIIRDGRLVEVNSVENLKTKRFKIVEVAYETIPEDEFFDREGLNVVDYSEKAIKLRISSNLEENLHHLTSHPLVDFVAYDPPLEEVFLSYYGNDNQ
ncbi:MAG: ABC transporter ATP-binding protein, partial [Candidatus Bipolaricaulia bacterium]